MLVNKSDDQVPIGQFEPGEIYDITNDAGTQTALMHLNSAHLGLASVLVGYFSNLVG